MESTEFQGKGEAPQTQWCLVYDRRTGAVVHIHQYIAASRDEAGSPNQLASQAIEQASKRQGREFLEVAYPADDAPLDFNARYRVDPASARVSSETLWRSQPKRTGR